MEDKLRTLLETKAFEQLSNAEKDYILTFISEEEYSTKYEALKMVKAGMKSEASKIKVDSAMQQQLMSVLKDKKAQNQEEEKSKVFFLFQTKVPLWTAVAAVFMVFLLSTPIFIEKDFNSSKTGVIASIDTVFVDKIIRDTLEVFVPNDTIYQTVYVKDNSRQIADDIKIQSNPIVINESPASINLEEAMVLGGYTNVLDFEVHQEGQSLSEDSIGQKIFDFTN